MSLRRFASLTALAVVTACGPSVDASESAAASDSTGASDTSTTAAELPDDLSWLVGKFTKSCAPSSQPPFVHGCSSDRFEEIEFHADGTMTAVHVMCGERSALPEVAEFVPGGEYGTASVTPAPGFDHVYMSGPASFATVRRTADCIVLDIVSTSGGSEYPMLYVRGSFDYVRGPEGCSAEAFAIEVPQCPDDGGE